MIDPVERINAQEIDALIAQQRYFVLHAPRQTGKTTSLLALVQHLNAQDRYRACYANIEGAQTARPAPETTLTDGVKQTAECADKCGADEGYLVIFDRRPNRSWDERIWQRAESHAGRTINVWGM
jgi:hypothetical protein